MFFLGHPVYWQSHGSGSTIIRSCESVHLQIIRGYDIFTVSPMIHDEEKLSHTAVHHGQLSPYRADPGFSFKGGGGGARKRLCASTHITSADPNSLSAGARLRVLEALGLF